MGTLDKGLETPSIEEIRFLVAEGEALPNAWAQELLQQRDGWERAAVVSRNRLVSQTAIERFKQDSIRKLKDEEIDLMGLLVRCKDLAMQTAQENNHLKRCVEHRDRTIKAVQDNLSEAMQAIQNLGHSNHCAHRLAFGDGECECGHESELRKALTRIRKEGDKLAAAIAEDALGYVWRDGEG